MSDVRQRFLADAGQTRAAGAALANAVVSLPLTAPLIITLQGELGAGKTTLVGGFMQALGFAGAVRSPTYTLMEPYEFADLTVWHLDLYRLTDPMQLEDLGLRDQMQARTIFLVEWADRGGDFFAHPQLAVTLSYATQGTVAGRELQLAIDPAFSMESRLTELADSLVF